MGVGWAEDELRAFLAGLSRLYRRRDVLRDRIEQLSQSADTVRSSSLSQVSVQQSAIGDPTHQMVARWVDELPVKRSQLAAIEIQIAQFESALRSLPPIQQRIVTLRYVENKEPYAVCAELSLGATTERDHHRAALRGLADMME